MKTNRRPVLNEDDEADMGVGTMIVFIAMVLVAGVAAGVLINVANDLQQQAQDTANQALANVATGFVIQEVIGDRVNSAGITTIARGGPTVSITSSDTDDVVTAAAVHNLIVGDTITIASHTGMTPDFNGAQTVATVPSTTTFTMTGIDITVGGTGGTVQIGGTLAIVTTSSVHGFSTADSITFSSVAGVTSTPTINGAHTITVVSTTTFSLDATYVNVAGTGGTATKSALRETITYLKIKANLQAGSPDIAMNNVIIQIADEANSAILRFNTATTYQTQWTAHAEATSLQLMNSATATVFCAEEWRDPGDTFYGTGTDSDNPDYVVSQGVLLRIYIDARAAGITISPQNTVSVILIPQNGAPTTEIFTTPESYSEQLIYLA